MAGATAILALAQFYGLRASATDTSVFGAYSGFHLCRTDLGLAGNQLLYGICYGTPRTIIAATDAVAGVISATPSRPACIMKWRCWYSRRLLILATLGEPNQFGTWTFIVLWWMHQSARLNVFLGVSNLNADFLPEHLAHIRSFFRNAPMNLLFPFSVTRPPSARF